MFSIHVEVEKSVLLPISGTDIVSLDYKRIQEIGIKVVLQQYDIFD